MVLFRNQYIFPYIYDIFFLYHKANLLFRYIKSIKINIFLICCFQIKTIAVKKHLFFLTLIFLLSISQSWSQRRSKVTKAVTYEELYDAPYEINKLFIQFQPVYGELFVSNVNAGFGGEVVYYMEDKFDFRAHARKTYSKRFDLARDIAEKNSSVDNVPNIFNYFELGATYHIKDFEKDSDTKMFLYKRSYRGGKWASKVPLNAEIPCKVRKVYGVRLGGFAFDTSTDLNRALSEQGLSNADIVDMEGNPLPDSFLDAQDGEQKDLSVFGNVDVKGLYIGGSMAWMKNVAVDFDRYMPGVDDLILTTYFDIMIAPSVTVDDIVYTERDEVNGEALSTTTYSTDAIKVNNFGFRLGVDGRFNRTLSWSYGGEFGYRPTVKGRGFFALLKISFPVYSTNLKYSVEAFGK